MNEFLEVLRIHGARLCLKINVIKAKSLRLRISRGEEVMLGDKKIDHEASFAYLGSTFSKDSGCNEYVKGRIAEAQGVSLKLKSLKE